MLCENCILYFVAAIKHAKFSHHEQLAPQSKSVAVTQSARSSAPQSHCDVPTETAVEDFQFVDTNIVVEGQTEFKYLKY